jgi:hypothetical protein
MRQQTIPVPNVARRFVVSVGQMERRVSKRMSLLAALFAGAAGVSCGAGIHDADEEKSMTKVVRTTGSTIDFMGASLEVFEGCVAEDKQIKLTWRRSISHTGALSSVYEVEVPTPDTFKKDLQINIPTTQKIAGDPNNVIGFMVPAIGVWVPDTSKASNPCSGSMVCGPVQSQTFDNPDPLNYPDLKTNVLRLAIVTRCGSGYSNVCPSGQSCERAGVCQACVDSSCP